MNIHAVITRPDTAQPYFNFADPAVKTYSDALIALPGVVFTSSESADTLTLTFDIAVDAAGEAQFTQFQKDNLTLRMTEAERRQTAGMVTTQTVS
jgi:hypothetical protein